MFLYEEIDIDVTPVIRPKYKLTINSKLNKKQVSDPQRTWEIKLMYSKVLKRGGQNMSYIKIECIYITIGAYYFWVPVRILSAS